MCCLFGFYNYSGEKIKNMYNLTNYLAENAEVRGTDATGIAYNSKGRLLIHKEAKSAHTIEFRHPDNAVCVMGHTRHATQGDKNKAYNNHPFGGSCGKLRFALAHNGILTNDKELKAQYNLPKTKIATDSYAAVQLLETKRELNADSIKFMAENVRGSFAFSILDSADTLWLVKGDSPLSLVHLPGYKLYVYASTEEILYKSLIDAGLFSEIKSGNFNEIPISSGDIMRISDGPIQKDVFNYTDCSGFARYWWNYGSDYIYIDDLKSVASYHGFSPEDIDELINDGFAPEEIEEYIYCLE